MIKTLLTELRKIPLAKIKHLIALGYFRQTFETHVLPLLIDPHMSMTKHAKNIGVCTETIRKAIYVNHRRMKYLGSLTALGIFDEEYRKGEPLYSYPMRNIAPLYFYKTFKALMNAAKDYVEWS